MEKDGERQRRPSRRICFFNDTATTEIYTLSLHDALPICEARMAVHHRRIELIGMDLALGGDQHVDRKSTRLNSSHQIISYAVFCLKKKTINKGGERRKHESRTPLHRRAVHRKLGYHAEPS